MTVAVPPAPRRDDQSVLRRELISLLRATAAGCIAAEAALRDKDDETARRCIDRISRHADMARMAGGSAVDEPNRRPKFRKPKSRRGT